MSSRINLESYTTPILSETSDEHPNKRAKKSPGNSFEETSREVARITLQNQTEAAKQTLHPHSISTAVFGRTESTEEAAKRSLASPSSEERFSILSPIPPDQRRVVSSPLDFTETSTSLGSPVPDSSDFLFGSLQEPLFTLPDSLTSDPSILYSNRPETLNLDRAKTTGIDDLKEVNIRNMDLFPIVNSREFSRRPKSTFQADWSIDVEEKEPILSSTQNQPSPLKFDSLEEPVGLRRALSGSIIHDPSISNFSELDAFKAPFFPEDDAVDSSANPFNEPIAAQESDASSSSSLSQDVSSSQPKSKRKVRSKTDITPSDEPELAVEAIIEVITGNIKVADVANAYGFSKRTLHRYVKATRDYIKSPLDFEDKGHLNLSIIKSAAEKVADPEQDLITSDASSSSSLSQDFSSSHPKSKRKKPSEKHLQPIDNPELTIKAIAEAITKNKSAAKVAMSYGFAASTLQPYVKFTRYYIQSPSDSVIRKGLIISIIKGAAEKCKELKATNSQSELDDSKVFSETARFFSEANSATPSSNPPFNGPITTQDSDPSSSSSLSQDVSSSQPTFNPEEPSNEYLKPKDNPELTIKAIVEVITENKKVPDAARSYGLHKGTLYPYVKSTREYIESPFNNKNNDSAKQSIIEKAAAKCKELKAKNSQTDSSSSSSPQPTFVLKSLGLEVSLSDRPASPISVGHTWVDLRDGSSSSSLSQDVSSSQPTSNPKEPSKEHLWPSENPDVTIKAIAEVITEKKTVTELAESYGFNEKTFGRYVKSTRDYIESPSKKITNVDPSIIKKAAEKCEELEATNDETDSSSSSSPQPAIESDLGSTDTSRKRQKENDLQSISTSITPPFNPDEMAASLLDLTMNSASSSSSLSQDVSSSQPTSNPKEYLQPKDNPDVLIKAIAEVITEKKPVTEVAESYGFYKRTLERYVKSTRDYIQSPSSEVTFGHLSIIIMAAQKCEELEATNDETDSSSSSSPQSAIESDLGSTDASRRIQKKNDPQSISTSITPPFNPDEMAASLLDLTMSSAASSSSLSQDVSSSQPTSNPKEYLHPKDNPDVMINAIAEVITEKKPVTEVARSYGFSKRTLERYVKSTRDYIQSPSNKFTHVDLSIIMMAAQKCKELEARNSETDSSSSSSPQPTSNPKEPSKEYLRPIENPELAITAIVEAIIKNKPASEVATIYGFSARTLEDYVKSTQNYIQCPSITVINKRLNRSIIEKAAQKCEELEANNDETDSLSSSSPQPTSDPKEPSKKYLKPKDNPDLIIKAIAEVIRENKSIVGVATSYGFCKKTLDRYVKSTRDYIESPSKTITNVDPSIIEKAAAKCEELEATNDETDSSSSSSLQPANESDMESPEWILASLFDKATAPISAEDTRVYLNSDPSSSSSLSQDFSSSRPKSTRKRISKDYLKPKDNPELTIKAIVEAISENKSTVEVARSYGFSEDTLKRYVRSTRDYIQSPSNNFFHVDLSIIIKAAQKCEELESKNSESNSSRPSSPQPSIESDLESTVTSRKKQKVNELQSSSSSLNSSLDVEEAADALLDWKRSSASSSSSLSQDFSSSRPKFTRKRTSKEHLQPIENPDITIKAIVEAISENKSITEVARSYGFSKTSLGRYVKATRDYIQSPSNKITFGNLSIVAKAAEKCKELEAKNSETDSSSSSSPLPAIVLDSIDTKKRQKVNDLQSSSSSLNPSLNLEEAADALLDLEMSGSSSSSSLSQDVSSSRPTSNTQETSKKYLRPSENPDVTIKAIVEAISENKSTAEVAMSYGFSAHTLKGYVYSTRSYIQSATCTAGKSINPSIIKRAAAKCEELLADNSQTDSSSSSSLQSAIESALESPERTLASLSDKSTAPISAEDTWVDLSSSGSSSSSSLSQDFSSSRPTSNLKEPSKKYLQPSKNPDVTIKAIVEAISENKSTAEVATCYGLNERTLGDYVKCTQKYIQSPSNKVIKKDKNPSIIKGAAAKCEELKAKNSQTDSSSSSSAQPAIESALESPEEMEASLSDKSTAPISAEEDSVSSSSKKIEPTYDLVVENDVIKAINSRNPADQKYRLYQVVDKILKKPFRLGDTLNKSGQEELLKGNCMMNLVIKEPSDSPKVESGQEPSKEEDSALEFSDSD